MGINMEEQLLENKNSPDYLGFITSEIPGRLFNYTPNGDRRLLPEEVEEVIEHLSEV
jgi:hypothetical protein